MAVGRGAHDEEFEGGDDADDDIGQIERVEGRAPDGHPSESGALLLVVLAAAERPVE